MQSHIMRDVVHVFVINQIPIYDIFSLFILRMCVYIVDARTDILNNEKKTALDMATNAQSASLLKRKLGGGESKGVSFQLPPLDVTSCEMFT